MSRHHKLLFAAAVLLCGAACQRSPDAAQSAASQPVAAAPATEVPVAAPTAVVLADVSERDPRYMVGISYPKGMERYPGLPALLQQYAQAARGELMLAVSGLGAEKPTAPYELSLAFNTTLDTPDLVAIAANGSTYTGGAHGNPLVARFVWLPQQHRALKIEDIVADKAGWQALSDYVREQLHASLSQRIDADDMAPVDRSELLRSGLKMIDEGSGPVAENFSQFEPIVDASGKLDGLRFVFSPYQVGPYSDGVQTVDVPASVLRPLLAPAAAGLFAPG